MRRVKFCIYVLQFKVFKMYLIYKVSMPEHVTFLAPFAKSQTQLHVHITSARLTSAFRPTISNNFSSFQIVVKIGKDVFTKIVHKA